MPRLPRPHATVRGRLLGLLLLSALPVLLLAAVVSHAFWRDGIGRALRDVELERDRVVAVNLATLEGTAALLAGLAPALAADPTLCVQLLSAAAVPGTRLAILDSTGAERCAGQAAQVGRRAGATASDAGAEPEDAVLRLSQPIPGEPGFASLVASIAPRAGRPDVLYWLADGSGVPRPFGPRPAPAGLPPAPTSDAAVEARAADGTALLVAAGTIGPGLRLAVALPAAAHRQAALDLALLHMAEIAALLGLSAAAILLGTAHAVTRPLRALRDAVVRWQAGARPLEIPEDADLPGELSDLADSIRAGALVLARREAELRAAMERAELLAGEVHHRVKNNLQTVSSLLALQANRVADPAARAEFEAARDRVAALATLHRHLYVEHDPEAIDLAAFIGELGTQLFASVGERPGRRIALDVAAPALRIATDQAVPLALVITEAVADALRQGFADGRAGRIAILLEEKAGRASLLIEDDGALPRPEDPLRAMLMRGLGRQLGGALKAEGGRVALDFPLRPPGPRQPVSIRPPSPPAPSPSSPRPAPSSPA